MVAIVAGDSLALWSSSQPTMTRPPGTGNERKIIVILTLAGLPITHGLRVVARESLLAVVAVAASSVVLALDADAATPPAGQLVEFRVEATLTSVAIAIAGCSWNSYVTTGRNLVVW